MASTAKLTIELSEDDFYRLQEESRKSGIRPEARVLELISRSFPPRRDDAFIALDRLRELRTGLPSVDSVELIRTVRDELEKRPFR